MTLQTPVPAIDVHTHLFPERLAAAVRRALTDMYGWSFDLPTDPSTFAAFVRERGTERFCILPYAHKPGMARSLNAWVAETAAALEGAIGFACVHPDDPDRLAIIDEAFGSGLHGIKLHYQVQGFAPDDLRMHSVYELMLERDRPLIVHAGKGPTDNGLVGVEEFRKLMARYPDLRICVAHLGWPERQEFVDLAGEFPRLYLDTSGSGFGNLRELRLDGVLDRIMWATDAPNIAYPYEDGIRRVLDLGLDAAGQRRVFRDNALAFLRI